MNCVHAKYIQYLWWKSEYGVSAGRLDRCSSAFLRAPCRALRLRILSFNIMVCRNHRSSDLQQVQSQFITTATGNSMSKLHPPCNNLYGRITLVQQVAKHANRYMNLWNACMYGHIYTTSVLCHVGNIKDYSLLGDYNEINLYCEYILKIISCLLCDCFGQHMKQ